MHIESNNFLNKIYFHLLQVHFVLKLNAMPVPVKTEEYASLLKQILSVYVQTTGLEAKDAKHVWIHVMTFSSLAVATGFVIKMKSQKKPDLGIAVNVIYGGVVSSKSIKYNCCESIKKTKG